MHGDSLSMILVRFKSTLVMALDGRRGVNWHLRKWVSA
jgi:hypothetical protein